MALTSLQARILSEIIARVRRENLPAGERLAELQFATALRTARSPVRAAFKFLQKRKVVQYQRNRGFFLVKPASELADIANEASDAARDTLYLQIAQARLNREIPDEIKEADLLRRFDVSRSRLRATLSRILQEGWIERVGNRWCFLPTITTDQAFYESMVFRATLEPAATLYPTFQPIADQLEESRRNHEFIVNEGFKTMTAMELWETNADFHEMIASWSGNRFIAQSVRRLTRIQGMLSYRQLGAELSKPAYRKRLFAEHLEILEKIANRDFIAAANLLRAHLESAQWRKPFAIENSLAMKAAGR